MAYKFSSSDYRTRHRAEPHRQHNRCLQERDPETDMDTADEAFEAKINKLTSIKRSKTCKCKISDSAEFESIQGIGFIDLYRRHFERHRARVLRRYFMNRKSSHRPQRQRTRGENSRMWEPLTSELTLQPSQSEKPSSSDFSRYQAPAVDRPTCSRYAPRTPQPRTVDRPTSSRYAPRTPQPPAVNDKPQRSRIPRTEPPTLDKPMFLPIRESYLRSFFRSEKLWQKHGQGEGVHRLSSEDMKFINIPKRISFKSPYAPTSLSRFSPRFCPRRAAYSEDFNACLLRCAGLDTIASDSNMEKLIESESNICLCRQRVEKPIESDSNVSIFKADTNMEQLFESDSNFSLFKSSENRGKPEADMFVESLLESMCRQDPCNELPSLGNEFVSGSRRNYEMDYRKPRIRAGAIGSLPDPMEPRFKISSTNRINFRPSCGNEKPVTKAKKRSAFRWQTFLKKPQAGEDPLLETLLSPRSLAYSNSSQSHDKRQAEDDEPAQSSSPKTIHELDISSLNLPEFPSSSAEQLPEACCSRGVRFPSLGSSHTFTNIWRRRAPRAGCSGAAVPPPGCLYGQGDKLKYQPIDRLDTGYSLVPLFQGSKAETRKRILFFATKFDQLSIAQRMQDTELRFHQLRTLQDKSDEVFFKHFQEHPFGERRTPIKEEARYFCPIGGRCCPPVTDETILSHKMTHHLNERGLELREVFLGDRLLLIFNPRSYVIGRNSCMSAVAYAGVYEDQLTMPGKRFMYTRNKKLPTVFARYREHLPLFVMICRNRRSVVDGPPREELDDNTGDGSEREDVLTVWVVSRDLTVPVHVMVTVVNRRMDATRTCVMQVRSLHRTQNCLKMMHSASSQYMRLDEQDLRVLSSDGTEPIYLEVTVKEYAGTLPQKQ